MGTPERNGHRLSSRRGVLLAVCCATWLTTIPLQAQDSGAASTEPLVDVRVVTDEADAVLALLGKRAGGENLGDAEWQSLQATEGYRRLKKRAEAFGKREFDSRFRE